MTDATKGLFVEVSGETRGFIWPFIQERIEELSVNVRELELKLGIDPYFEERWLATINVDDYFDEAPLKIKAERGNLLAANDYGVALNEELDPRAINYIKHAAINGVPYGAVNLGSFYLHGLGGAKRNVKQAFRWNMIAAKQGHPDGAVNVGFQYENGIGTSRNRELAELWYVYSAIRGSELGYGALLSLRKSRDDIKDVISAMRGRLN